MKKFLFPVLLFVLLTGCGTTPSPSTTPSNTGVNVRDANTTATALDQSNKLADIDQVASIRKAVLEIDKISVNGQNVKIISGEGKVILRGPVDTASEREAIQRVAENIADPGNVTNEVGVKSN